MSVRGILLSFAATVAAIPAWGAGAVVLQDGQVLEGADVRRQGEEVLLTLEGGNVISLPASVVKEIRLTGDGAKGKTPPPTALRREGPETLVGNKVEAPRRSDQLANAGSSSRFAEGVVDSDWQPRSDLDLDPSNNEFAPSTWARGPVDPNWEPDSAFDARDDVLTGGRSAWQRSIVDPTWKPENGFRRREAAYVSPSRGGRPVRSVRASPASRGAEPVPEPPTPSYDPALCAETLRLPPDASGEAAPPRVARLSDRRYDAFPFPLWEASAGSGDSARRIVFTVVADTCRVLGGDLEPASDEPLSRGLRVSRGMLDLDAALSGSPSPALDSAGKKIALAFAAVAVTDPDVSGGRRAEIRLLDGKKDLESLERGSSKCDESPRKRKKALQRAVGRFAVPSVDQGPGGTVVRFQAWTSDGGRVAAYEVFVGNDGRAAMKKEDTASHLGGHVDRPTDTGTARR